MRHNEHPFKNHPDNKKNHHQIDTEEKTVPLSKEKLRFNYQSCEGDYHDKEHGD